MPNLRGVRYRLPDKPEDVYRDGSLRRVGGHLEETSDVRGTLPKELQALWPQTSA